MLHKVDFERLLQPAKQYRMWRNISHLFMIEIICCMSPNDIVLSVGYFIRSYCCCCGIVDSSYICVNSVGNRVPVLAAEMMPLPHDTCDKQHDRLCLVMRTVDVCRDVI